MVVRRTSLLNMFAFPTEKQVVPGRRNVEFSRPDTVDENPARGTFRSVGTQNPDGTRIIHCVLAFTAGFIIVMCICLTTHSTQLL